MLFCVSNSKGKEFEKEFCLQLDTRRNRATFVSSRRGIKNTSNNRTRERKRKRKGRWRPKYSLRETYFIKSIRRNASTKNIFPHSPTPTRVSLTKSAFKKSQVKFLPSFVSACASKDRNFGDDIIYRIYPWETEIPRYRWSPKSSLDRVIPKSGEWANNKSTEREREREEMGKEAVGGPIELRLCRTRWFGREGRAGSRGRRWRRMRRKGGSRIDRQRWGPTPRRLREGRITCWLDLMLVHARLEPRERNVFRDPFTLHSCISHVARCKRDYGRVRREVRRI